MKRTLDGTKEYFKWEKPGQEVTGIFRKMETARGEIKGQLVHLEDEEGKGFMVSAPVVLADIISDNLSAIQDRLITITYTAEDAPKKRGQSGVKRFKVEFDDETDD
jgi:hypothetical protein